MMARLDTLSAQERHGLPGGGGFATACDAGNCDQHDRTAYQIAAQTRRPSRGPVTQPGFAVVKRRPWPHA
jgi:hypothetical protein